MLFIIILRRGRVARSKYFTDHRKFKQTNNYLELYPVKKKKK